MSASTTTAKGKRKHAVAETPPAPMTVSLAAAAPAAVVAASLDNLTGLARDALREVHDAYVATGNMEALPPEVLNRARDPQSPLHRYFEWDDTLAAEAHRLTQAEGLVRRVKVTLLPAGAVQEVKVRWLMATRELHDAAVAGGDTDVANAPTGSYTAIGEITGNASYEAAKLLEIQKDLKRLQYKYRLHAELFQTAVQSLGT